MEIPEFVQRPFGRPRKHPEPDATDIELIAACKKRREEIPKEIAALRAQIQQLQKDASELSNEKLCEKFDLTLWVIRQI